MTRSRLALAALLAGAVSAGTLGCKKDEPAPAPAPTVETAPAAVEVRAVTLGRAIGPDKRVTAAVETFAPGDTIYAAVETEGVSSSSTLAARWTYEDGQVVDETTLTIAPNGPEVTEFHVSKPDGWPAGSYQVAITLDGREVERASFTVAGS